MEQEHFWNFDLPRKPFQDKIKDKWFNEVLYGKCWKQIMGTISQFDMKK
jgi:hypothetical protein